MPRKLSIGERTEVEFTGLYLDAESGRWRAHGTDRPQPRKWERVERWRARARFGAHDGTTKEVSRIINGDRGKAQVVAEGQATVSKAIDKQMRGNVAGHDEDARLTAHAEAWLAQIGRAGSGKSAGTIRQYVNAYRRMVDVPGSEIRGLTLAQVNRAHVLRHFLQDVADEHGTGSARMVRTVLSGILGQAVDDGILMANAMRSVSPVQAADGLSRQRREAAEERDTERALTVAEREAVLTHADHLVEVGQDGAGRAARPAVLARYRVTADMVHFLAGTGVRIGEALSLRWEDVNLDEGTVQINGTKSTASKRRLPLPGWLAERLTERAEREGTEGHVFAAPNTPTPGSRWDNANAGRAVSAVLHGAGCSWATPHVFRRTVATRLHEAGVPLVKIADQLGHADPSVTMREYLGRVRGTVHADLAEHL